ncbi:hypothetical protein IWQ56_001485, partial [Coemansia nantahalensis]
ANYEEILSGLEQDIRRAEKQRAQASERMEWCARNWLFYTGLGWVAYVLGFTLHVWPERHRGQAGGFMAHVAALALIPAAMYYGNAAIRALWQRSIRKHDARIARLRAELKERLDELKKKTAFDSTKSLIDRFSAGEGAPPHTAAAAAGTLPARLSGQDAKNRRRTMPNFGAPGLKATGAPSAPSLTAKPQPQQQQQQQQQRRVASLGAHGVDPGAAPNAATQHAAAGHGNHPALPPLPAGVVKVASRPPTGQGSGGQRPWLDKLVDQLVGDVGSSQDKYALICRHCYAHNGLVLEEEIRHIQYSCPKCGKFNPSPASLRAGSSTPATGERTPGPDASEPDSSNVPMPPGSDDDSDGQRDDDDQYFLVDDRDDPRRDRDHADSDDDSQTQGSAGADIHQQSEPAPEPAKDDQQPPRGTESSASLPEKSLHRKRKGAGKARKG